MFSTSIRENIVYARHNASETEIKEAARIANAHHFISSLPKGYDTKVGPGGVELTPGPKTSSRDCSCGVEKHAHFVTR
ncbi:putative ABC-type xenobiotic transporter [Helianthus annuus]|nr:putative ABC-type xenobiotic transporter [Helianthus annuus]